MEKITTFYPAYDKRDPKPSKNYGIHGVNLLMVLKGELGAVQFLLYTGWHLPHVTKELRSQMHPENYSLFEPMPADLGYHSPKPMYEGDEPNECDLLNGKKCYYDGSTLNAEPVYIILLEKGSDGVWQYLEEYYTERFGELR